MDNGPGVVSVDEARGLDMSLGKNISEHEHQRVLECCVDVPSEEPSFPIHLGEVGISNKTVWARLPEGLLPFTARLTVDLPSNLRGIHMSRMEEVISSLYGLEFNNLPDYAVALVREVIDHQDGKTGLVNLQGKMPVLRETSVPGKPSLDTIDLEVEVEVGKEKGTVAVVRVMLGVGVNHITVCPCTQAYNRVLFESEAQPCPLPSHSQRSFTQLRIETDGELPPYAEILKCLESALHVTQDLLKRRDEAEIVLKSHRHPQFAEDAVRETALTAGKMFGGKLADETRIYIESISLESIHIHDVTCRLVTTLREVTGKK
ncbi:MAG: GTP cyclohydrolase I FolE2 [Proteobacteria bacterium]|nr:GTP cyclohydrolase I FolE2 [Pseudomonadota bacterium]MBU1716940.1 GTP cyclohydrolase I FolE2 [Pseudomonadota bacterium]